jgi:CelD/BcsL family acetyltransferase involved in cellulose biosynthesis
MSYFRITIAQSPAEMDALAPLWSELLRQQEHTVFQQFSWNRLAADVFSDRITPYVVAVESASGAAIIPAAIHQRENRIELLGEALFDYRDVLCHGDSEGLTAAWQELAKLEKSLHVLAIEDGAIRQRWSGFPMMPFANAPQVDSSIVDDGKFRLSHSRLGRQMRRLQKQGAVQRCFSGTESDVVRHIYDGKRNHFADNHNGNVFLDQRRCEFMVAAAAMEGSACEIYTLEKDSALIAGLVTFRDGPVRRFYTTYFSPEWARYSPGQALLYEITAQSLVNGLSCDYMTGEYAYKLRLANASKPLLRLDVSVEKFSEIVAGAASRAA